MGFPLSDELLSAFLDGEVTPEERQHIEAQLAQSPEWQRRYRQLVESVNLVRTLPPVSLEKDLAGGILAEVQRRQATVGEEPNDTGAVPDSRGLTTSPATIPSPSSRQSERFRRHRRRNFASMWYLLAACLLIALGIGVSYRLGWMGDGDGRMIAQDDPSTQDPQSVPKHATEDPSERTTEERPNVAQSRQVTPESPDDPARTSPFPTVDELAQEQRSSMPDPQQVEDDPSSRSPIGIRVRRNRRPQGDSPDTSMPVRPPALARSVFNLERQDDPGFDQQELPRLEQEEAAEEIVAWLDADGDGRVSDLEAQQSWQRFQRLDSQEKTLSEAALRAIDQDENQKISAAEFYAAVAVVRLRHTPRGAEAERFWFRLDANEDGIWSPEDFAANGRFVTSAMPPFNEQLAQWHALVDLSHNGQVTLLEFALSADFVLQNFGRFEQSILHPQVYQQTRQLLRDFDRDGNGRLAGREWRRLKEELPDLAQQLGEPSNEGFTAYQLYQGVEAKARGK